MSNDNKDTRSALADSAEEVADLAERLAEWAENEAHDAISSDAFDSIDERNPTDNAGHQLLLDALGTETAVARALGKPSLSGSGTSPTRRFRLPQELDKKLDRFTAESGTNASAVMRSALEEYFSHHMENA